MRRWQLHHKTCTVVCMHSSIILLLPPACASKMHYLVVLQNTIPGIRVSGEKVHPSRVNILPRCCRLNGELLRCHTKQRVMRAHRRWQLTCHVLSNYAPFGIDSLAHTGVTSERLIHFVVYCVCSNQKTNMPACMACSTFCFTKERK